MNEKPKVLINLTETDNKLILHAPLPGVEPEDIVVSLEPGRIMIQSAPRGNQQDGMTRHLHEWRIGKYSRSVALPKEVNSERVNVTYKNGVLTVTMPIGTQTATREIRMTKVKSAHGEKVGHRGRA